jgi:hypothetical protein
MRRYAPLLGLFKYRREGKAGLTKLLDPAARLVRFGATVVGRVPAVAVNRYSGVTLWISAFAEEVPQKYSSRQSKG